MKIAIIGSASNQDTFEYNLEEAFIFAGHECKRFDAFDKKVFKMGIISGVYRKIDELLRIQSNSYDKSIFKPIAEKIINYKPDLVIVTYRMVHPECISTIKKTLKYTPIIHINPDSIQTLGLQQVFASNYDKWFVKDPYMVKFMRDNMHLNTTLYYEAFNPRIHKRPKGTKKEWEDKINIDVTTYGTMYCYRSNMLEIVKNAGINIKAFGVKPRRFFNPNTKDVFQNKYIIGEEKAKILYGSKIVFNQMHYAEIESVNCRFFEANGCEAFQLVDYRPILKEILPVDPELVCFRSIDEGIDKIKYYLSHPEERYELADKIYQYTSERFSYDHLIDYILKNIS